MRREEMIFFSDKYSESIRELQQTQRSLGTKELIVVFEDDGFLPSGISSPYEYYIISQNHEWHKEKALICDSLKIPDYWEMRQNGMTAGIYYMGYARATVYFLGAQSECKTDFAETKKKQIVQRVEWCMENGRIYKVDYYNKYGLKYVSEFRDARGTVESKIFYSDTKQEVIVEYPGNGVVTLLENGIVKAFFNSRAEFLKYFMMEVSVEEKRVFFVQDDKMLESLSIKSDQGLIWEYVLFYNEDLLNKYIDLGGNNGIRFYSIPEHYPENKVNGEALILTNSDQIEKLEELTLELPDMEFHVAANTLVSDKLKKIGEQENVHIYPCVSQETLDKLWDRCDFYLDINHWREIRDAVNVAHQKNLLLMGFENTLHHKELLVDGCIYQAQDYKKMVLVIKYILKNSELMQKLLLVQQSKKEAIWRGLKFMENVKENGMNNLD